ncbi:glutamate receptor U1-like isoform X1 [Centruroides sculpturatus]|uniref:glutamate receptor U1-like isoform X1 n=2 Tax=Centruroides sculpturatus TaxID=218467 RepID=UPI000C6C92B5|nr:glutamate receptor U1-like isoform X1 [Centruroides sculpturatus]XP_023215019.1 glutamate receptor U1-like isoform X1 [Centruroides sculpturatus]
MEEFALLFELFCFTFASNLNSESFTCSNIDAKPPKWTKDFLNQYFLGRNTIMLYTTDCNDYMIQLAPQFWSTGIFSYVLSLKETEKQFSFLKNTSHESTQPLFIFISYYDLPILNLLNYEFDSKMLWWIILVDTNLHEMTIPSLIEDNDIAVCHLILATEKVLSNGTRTWITSVPTYQQNEFCAHIIITTSVNDKPVGDLFNRYLDRQDRIYFKNKTISVAYYQSFPFFFELKDNVSNTLKYGGVDFNIVEELAKYFQFEYNFVYSEDGISGDPINDTWSGSLGMVLRKEVDIAVTHISLSTEREEIVDFTFPYFYDGVIIMTRYTGEKSRASAVIRPFSNDIWVAIIIAFLLTSLMVPLIVKLSDDNTDSKWSFWRALWYFYGCLLQQGGTKTPFQHSLRILFAIWWIFSVIICSSFSGIVTSCLYQPIPNDQIETVNQLLKKLETSEYKVGTLNSSSILRNIGKSKDGPLYQIRKNIQKNKREQILRNKDDVTKWVKSGFHAFIYPSSILKIQIAHLDDKNYVFSQDQIYSLAYAVALRRNSSMDDRFNRVIEKLSDSGLVEKWMDDVVFKKRISMQPINNATLEEGSDENPIILSDLVGAFVVLGIGYFLSSFVFSIEFTIYELQF